LICYDVEFPEAVRTLRLGGAELVLVPTALTNRFNALITVPSRAFENLCYICYTNRAGTGLMPAGDDGNRTPINYCGLSVLADPAGREPIRFDEQTQALKIATIDKSDKHVLKNNEQNPYLHDRRPELYRL
jgi:predicted amidohydrolase